MNALVSQVHLFICLDAQVSPGPVLQCLDLIRAKDWQQEIVLVCDGSWRKYVSPDQPVIFLNKADFYKEGGVVNSDVLDHLLEQLDSFEILRITQIGELSWGRWLKAYLDELNEAQFHRVAWQGTVSSIQLINEISHELGLDVTLPVAEKPKSADIYIDPYIDEVLSPRFIELFSDSGGMAIPSWINIVAREKDFQQLSEMGLEEHLVDWAETEISLFNQFILCFSDESLFSLTSRAYNVALYHCESDRSLFVPGDISIIPRQSLHLTEFLNILAYWKTNRLKELAFQWFNMGIEISVAESFHNRILKRNLQNYSSDLHHCERIIENFARKGESNNRKKDIIELIYRMRNDINNDPYALSFSLKILVMITERMLASAACGERLFERLGSDHHRIIIGEAMIEGIINGRTPTSQLNIPKTLKSFLSYLMEIDDTNDQVDIHQQMKEP